MSAKLLTDFNGKPNKTSIRCWNLKVDGELDFSSTGNKQFYDVDYYFVNFIDPGDIYYQNTIKIELTKIGQFVVCKIPTFSIFNSSSTQRNGFVYIDISAIEEIYLPNETLRKIDIIVYEAPVVNNPYLIGAGATIANLGKELPPEEKIINIVDISGKSTITVVKANSELKYQTNTIMWALDN